MKNVQKFWRRPSWVTVDAELIPGPPRMRREYTLYRASVHCKCDLRSTINILSRNFQCWNVGEAARKPKNLENQNRFFGLVQFGIVPCFL